MADACKIAPRPASRTPALRMGVVSAALAAALSATPVAAEAPRRPAQQATTVLSDGARPALWRVADADTTVFLFGSIHALREGDKWRFAALDDALAAAETVYFEAPTDLLAQAGVSLLLARLAFLPEGETLSSLLSPKGRVRLARAAARFSLRSDAIERMRPWYAFMVLAAAAALSSGADPALGVDGVLELEARSAGKEIRTFETLEQQLRFFADLEQADQVAVLESSLQEFEDVPDQLSRIVDAWKIADLAALEQLALEGMAEAPQAFFETIYTDRNREWAQALDRVLREETGVFLVVVGAAHLVGDEAVQALLAARGHRVARE